MWILLVIRPRTLHDYIRMCRLYGMTMADIRMQEAWSMAHWLARATPPAYGIENDAEGIYDLLLWPDGALTRTDRGATLVEGVRRLYSNVPGESAFAFIVENGEGRLRIYEYPIHFIPFSTYELGMRPPQSLCIVYRPPDRNNRTAQSLLGLAPRGMRLVAHAIRTPGQTVVLQSLSDPSVREVMAAGSTRGRLLRTRLQEGDMQFLTT